MSLGLVLAAMTWLSRLLLKLDAEGKSALQQAAFEENVRLALWRMDSALTGLISLENARPYASYQSLTRTLPEGARAGPAGDLAAASPMQSLLYFQFEPDGRLVLPEAAKTQSARLDELHRKVTTSEQLRSIQYTTEILTVQKQPNAERPAEGERAVRQAGNFPDFGLSSNSALPLQWRTKQDVQQEMSSNELSLRNSLVAQNVSINDARFMPPNAAFHAPAQPAPDAQPPDSAGTAAFPGSAPAAHQSGAVWVTGMASQNTNLELMNPVWLNEDLFLVRRVSIGAREGAREYMQGCLLNWPGLRGMLLNLIADLLPKADLLPLRHPPEAGETRLLASIPVQLVPDPIPMESRDGWSVLHASLWIAWTAVLLATLAVAVVLRRTMELTQRRGAFVSAVTHELRTPLTTFRMYTEMLDEGMVSEGGKQKKYLGTLRGEAERLSHLVENVLGYAQLEIDRGGAERVERLHLADLKERIAPRLAERAAQNGIELKLEMEDAARDSSVVADIAAVERILFNLVDNAGKYGRGGQDSAVLLSIGLNNRTAVLAIRDDGPGIPPRLRKKLFAPFSKSASDAANSAPGIGLGLSISRRLARQMRGDLVLDRTVTQGARFVLTLPLAQAGRSRLLRFRLTSRNS